MCLESVKAINEDFNISTPRATSVLELAALVWSILNPDKEFTFISDKAYEYDVQKRIPATSKAKKMLGFKAEIGLEESVREVIKYMRGRFE
jgi:nucleoside-diphosphate-sugar epimerase